MRLGPEAGRSLQIESQQDIAVNVIDPTTNQTLQTVPPKEVEFSVTAPGGTNFAIYPMLVMSEDGNTVSVWNWVQLLHPTKFYLKRTRVAAFILDETMLQIGSVYAWLWVAIEPVHRQVLGVHVSRHSNMLVAEYFLRSLIKVYGKYLYIQMADHGILRHVLILV
jgi:hypothetical protein